LEGGIADLNKIKERANTKLFSQTQPNITKSELLEDILKERNIELFSEWGHRWLDLKRTGKATKILGIKNPLWHETDIFYPIPEAERMKNPNLDQSLGY